MSLTPPTQQGQTSRRGGRGGRGTSGEDINTLNFCSASPLNSEGPHQTAHQPESSVGQGLRHLSDLLGELGVGKTLGLELQQVGEDADDEVDQLDGEEDQEGGEVSYLEKEFH